MNKYVRFEFVPKGADPFVCEYFDMSDDEMNEMSSSIFNYLTRGGVVYFNEHNRPGVDRQKTGKSRFINMSEIVTFTVTYSDSVPQ